MALLYRHCLLFIVSRRLPEQIYFYLLQRQQNTAVIKLLWSYFDAATLAIILYSWVSLQFSLHFARSKQKDDQYTAQMHNESWMWHGHFFVVDI